MTIVPTTVPPIPYSRRIADLVATRGDDVVLTFVPIAGDEVTSTWRQLDARSSQIARALIDRGLSYGDRLAIGLRNSTLLVEAALAAWKVGAIPVPQTVLVSAPLYHTNGFMTLYNLIAGDHIVLMEKFDAARIPDLVERHRISTLTMPSTMLQRIVDLPGVDDRDWSSVEWVLQGAAVIAPSLVRRWVDLVGAERFFMAYGMTEGLGLTALRADEWLEHPGSVGRGYRDTEIRILDEDGKDVGPGEIGEIFLRSPTSGLYKYLGGAPRLAKTDDGFETAGDMGWLEDGGFLHIVDRRVDMIVSGGANVYPAEVESALIEHPKIADVVVIGLRDPDWGRRVHAVVQPRDPASPPTPEALDQHARNDLTSYKVPKTYEFLPALPRNEAGKIRRSALAAERESGRWEGMLPAKDGATHA
jgi:bile acid-coenzyme A ligase